jgi:muramidase (phage lysozyme)
MSRTPGNLGAFLDAIARSEGTSTIPNSDDGYKVIVGSTPDTPLLMSTYADHPRRLVWIPSIRDYSTAAGRYQEIARNYDAYRKLLGLPDFGPESQDRIATQQIAETGATDDILAGRFADAVAKVAHLWASFPSAGYGQHEQTMALLERAYSDAGGTFA